MRRALLLLILCAACKESKQDKCNKTWDRMNELAREMAKAFGGSDADMPTDQDRKDFMDKCMKLSDEALACITDPAKAMDPKCEEILDKAEEAEPVSKVELQWEEQPVADKRATARVPKGWKHEEMLGDMWSPPDDAKLGFSDYEINDGCGGECSAQPAAEWAKRVQDDVASLASDKETTISKDEKLGDTGRLIVATTKMGHMTQTKVFVYQWKDGGELYFVCKAELDRALSANTDEFVDACKAMKVQSFSATVEGDDFDTGDEADAGK